MPDNITTGKLMELIEEALRKGFRAGETHAAATEVSLRHGLGPDVGTAWQEYRRFMHRSMI